jgi:hypothetical protein
MAKHQTRRGVTLNRDVYERLKNYCAAVPIPMAALVEDLIRAHLARGVVVAAPPQAAQSHRVTVPPAHLEVGVDLSGTEGARLQRRLVEINQRLIHARGEKVRDPLESEREEILDRLRAIRTEARAVSRRQPDPPEAA